MFDNILQQIPIEKCRIVDPHSGRKTYEEMTLKQAVEHLDFGITGADAERNRIMFTAQNVAGPMPAGVFTWNNRRWIMVAVFGSGTIIWLD